MITRRQALMTTLFGAGGIGLRALATGLPASLLLDPRRALADGLPPCGSNAKAQYFVFSTSGQGDPINASAPGTYEDPNIVHSPEPSMAPTPLTLGGQTYTAGAPWATLPRSVLDRTTFWHLMTNTPVHPKQPEVLRLMDVTAADEMLPSILAKALAPCLGTVQAQPISIGAATPSEGITYEGRALPIIPALALKATLTSPDGPLTRLQATRDQALGQIYDVYKNGASPAQKAYIDALVTSQGQVRSIRQDLLNQLSQIKDNSPASQMLAAVTLIQMKVTPVVVVHVPFGGDNHSDAGLKSEAAQTVSGVATIASLMTQLASAGLSDQVSFVSLNVFGRTLGPASTNGRQHNANHQTSITIGKPFRSGVIGAVAPVAGDYGCTPIDSKTGKGTSSGDITAVETLASFGQTLLAAIGADPAPQIPRGKVIASALA